jgi:YD repeat-containing protein
VIRSQEKEADMKTVRLFVLISLFAPSPLFAQAFKDSLVQAPSIARPERGSIAGSLSKLSFGPAELARGTFDLPSPFALPIERGAPLVSIAPTYSPENGASEWGMGWGAALSLKRFRVVGDLDYANDDLTGPWGRMVRGSDGAFYPAGYAVAVRVTADGEGWTAIDASGTRYFFRAADAVRNTRGIYEWMLSRVESATGDRMELEWERNASGRAFLSRARYGGRGATLQYAVELAYTTITPELIDRRSGSPLSLDRRVASVVIRVLDARTQTYEPRWTYATEFLVGPTGPAFYLASVIKSYAAGGSEPAIRYQYVLAEEQLDAARLEPLTTLDQYLATAGNDAIQPDRAAMLDVDRDGLIDFEHPATQTLFRQTEAGWIEEPLPAPSGATDSMCRPPASPTNPPRTLVRMAPGAEEPHVVVTRASGSNTAMKICDRSGSLLREEIFTGGWVLGPNTRLVDLNRDLEPDLIRVARGAYEVIENRSTESTFSFSRRPLRPLSPAFTPISSWVHDVNGDGIADLVSRFTAGVVVWYGNGNFAFEPTGATFRFVTSNGTAIANLGLYQLTFVDVNKDGLMDAILSREANLHLFTNRGDHFREVNVPGFADVSWAFGYPVAADLGGGGEEQCVVVNGTHAYALTLTAPDAGLLQSADDGKGTVIAFSYERAPATAGIDRRPSMLAGMVMRSSGYDDVAHRYDYHQPVFHSRAEFLVGFSLVRKESPFSVEEIQVHNDDDVSGLVLSNASFDGRVLGIHPFTERTYEEANIFNVRLMRPSSEQQGWTGEAGRIIAREKRWVSYERGRCPTELVTTSRHGTLTASWTLAAVDPSWDDLHCLHGEERVAGAHADPELDFVHAARFARDGAGQLTELASVGNGVAMTMQTIEYDAQHRISRVITPGQGTTTVEYDPITGRIASVTAPDGVITRVAAADSKSDLVLELETDRAGLVWRESFRYDGLERLERRWDDGGSANELAPLSVFRYRFATADRPASIATDTLIDPARSAIERRIELMAADGEAILAANRIPEGWSTGRMRRVLRNEGRAEEYWVAPLQGAIDVEPPLFSELASAPATLLSNATLSSFGPAVSESTVIADGVLRSRTTELTLEDGLLARTVRENGAIVSTTLDDGSGLIVAHRDAAGTVTSYGYDALGRLVEIALPPETGCP